MGQTTCEVTGMAVTKIKVVWKHMRRTLVRSHDQGVNPTWIRSEHCVMEPVTSAANAADSQTWCFVGAVGGLMVIANNTNAWVLSVYTTSNVAVCDGV